MLITHAHPTDDDAVDVSTVDAAAATLVAPVPPAAAHPVAPPRAPHPLRAWPAHSAPTRPPSTGTWARC